MPRRRNSPGYRADGSRRRVAADARRRGAQGETSPGKLVLLADGPEGYRALCRLTSLLQAGPDRETLMARGLDWETLAAHAGGVYALSGGRAGWIERLLRAGDRSRAAEMAARFAGIYQSRARLALEIHDPADLAIAEAVAEIGRRFGIECVAVQPIYCLAPDDAEMLRLLAAIRGNIPLQGLPEDAVTSGRLHWLTPSEMRERYARFPQAIEATGELARACRPGLPDGNMVWPDLDLAGDSTPDEALRRLAVAGLIERYGPQADTAVAQTTGEGTGGDPRARLRAALSRGSRRRPSQSPRGDSRQHARQRRQFAGCLLRRHHHRRPHRARSPLRAIP